MFGSLHVHVQGLILGIYADSKFGAEATAIPQYNRGYTVNLAIFSDAVIHSFQLLNHQIGGRKPRGDVIGRGEVDQDAAESLREDRKTHAARCQLVDARRGPRRTDAVPAD